MIGCYTVWFTVSLALYEEDVLGFVKEAQNAQWQKDCKLYPNNTDKNLLERVSILLNKANPNAVESMCKLATEGNL